ncbi:hypothetical protein ABZP36_035720 [Zizania latifolia]
MVATHGDSNDFLRCTDIIYRKDNHLLFKSNNKGDTPLHCAARAGKSKMVCHLIDLAIDFGTHEGDTEKSLKGLLRKENTSKETALHEAVRFGDNDIVDLLMTRDSELATFPEQGTSPLYLSILLENDIIAKTLYDKSKGNNLSYSGPDGQNALHAAVFRSKAMTVLLLKWNKNLTTQGDKNGSTHLHFAASSRGIRLPFWGLVFSIANFRRDKVVRAVRQVLRANGVMLYQPDNCGMLPIHVAASVGELENIKIFINEYPCSAGLRDKRGRTFLHIAVENDEVNIVSARGFGADPVHLDATVPRQAVRVTRGLGSVPTMFTSAPLYRTKQYALWGSRVGAKASGVDPIHLGATEARTAVRVPGV